MGTATAPVVDAITVGIDGWCHTYCSAEHFLCGAIDPRPDVPPHESNGPPGPVCATCGKPSCPTCDELWANGHTVCIGCGAVWQR